MLTSMYCPDTISASWVPFAGMLTGWLVRPLFVLPFFVLLFSAASLLPRAFGRRPVQMAVVGLGLVYALTLFPVTANVAEVALEWRIPHDSGAAADAVVVLGRGGDLNPSRVEVAAQLWKERRAPLIFASGISDAPKILTMLRDKGIPDQQLQGEECSRTTYENAEYTSTLLRPQGVQRILLVTDGPHMLRSWLTFRGFGFTVTPIVSAGPDSLSRVGRTRLILREYLGLVSYGLLGRFSSSPQSSAMSGPQPSVSQPLTASYSS
ncbi:YdcF family protein [Thermocoleostomius sinensis]|jgi:uncharacterized SAM-binding protein YcdF (DUF218 family)|uniref:YdcF family protein n=1 Tax=Thermocoleostomius sinensis A174 TaxID=2016057 RepID=A0A9E9C8P3_9CYAN|nr:YdcF family protein [Thermocoleostomius sinensis]WAL61624.1 YdcF family protein [Thermocoleostomius sinensis A174]